jgi:hypothetical protein
VLQRRALLAETGFEFLENWTDLLRHCRVCEWLASVLFLLWVVKGRFETLTTELLWTFILAHRQHNNKQSLLPASSTVYSLRQCDIRESRGAESSRVGLEVELIT